MTKRKKKAYRKQRWQQKNWHEHSVVFSENTPWDLVYDQVKNKLIPQYGNGRPWSYAVLRTLGNHCTYRYGKPHNQYPPISRHMYAVSIYSIGIACISEHSSSGRAVASSKKARISHMSRATTRNDLLSQFWSDQSYLCTDQFLTIWPCFCHVVVHSAETIQVVEISTDSSDCWGSIEKSYELQG